MNILLTGCAGFIGYHTTLDLLKKYKVIGVDNLSNYYDVNLKKSRIREIIKSPYKKNFCFIKTDLSDYQKVKKIFKKYKIKKIIHLAAQAGVRHSLKKPEDYLTNNVNATFNLLKLSVKFKINHFLFASTSSVYGSQIKMPFEEKTAASHPIQFYAASKRSCELMCHSYSHLYNLPVTVLRFFTVYGPWGRPDMALFDFTKKILKKKKITVYNYGNHSRDFTYVKDVANGVIKILNKIPKKQKISIVGNDPSISDCPFAIYNIGGGKPVELMDYIKEIEKNIGLKAKIKFTKLQPGDIKKTYCSTNKLKSKINYMPNTSIKVGIKNFVKWYRNFYKT